MKHSRWSTFLRRAAPWVLDGLAAVAATYSAVALTTEISSRLPQAPMALGLVLAVIHSAPVALRRVYPLATLCLALASAWAYTLAGFPVFYLGFASLFYLYSVGSHLPRRLSLLGLGLGEVTAAFALLPGERGPRIDSWLFYSVLLAMAWYLGDSARRRQAAAEAHAARARQLEAAREELARRAVTEERVTIARELHDIVAHSMSVIALHAGIGRMVIDSDREKARHALGVIETTSRSALDEMRRLLGVLRRPDDRPGSLDPAPGLADLPVLVAQVVDSGLSVNVKVEGHRQELSAGVDLAAYRIIQEALTNAVKHAGPGTSVKVSVVYADDGVALEVIDDGPGSKEPVEAEGGAGRHQGLIGLRERVSIYGGRLESGSLNGRGYRLAAYLPLQKAGQ